MSNAWGFNDVEAALPDANGHQNGDSNDHTTSTQDVTGTAGTAGTTDGANGNSNPDFQAHGWAKPETFDLGVEQQNVQWEGNAVVYHWDGEQGDVGPEYPELEEVLFGPVEERKTIRGIDFSKIADIEVNQEGPRHIEPIATFKDAGLHPVMLRNVELAGYDVPTPIQKYTLPAVHLGHDVIGIAQTGSGKTAAYMIPILNKMMGKAKKLAAKRPNPADFVSGITPYVRAEPLVVVVCPSRELAVQIFNEARKFCYRTMLRPCVIYGGGPLRDQIAQLGKGCDVLVATPGRLADMIQRPEVLTLRRLRYLVIDEADEMLQDDWQEEFQVILTGGEQDEGNVKYMLFSATFPKSARDLAKDYMHDQHVRFRVGRAGSTVSNIRQSIVACENPEKKTMLLDLLQSLPPCRTIIFVNSKRMADDLDDFLFNLGLPCTSIHSDRTQLEREAAMRGFRAGKSPILIATGVTSRGIDVRNVHHVINFDLPSMDHGGIEEYVHRIGRTGRVGHRGLATSFYTSRDEPIASVLTRLLLETNQEVPACLEEFKPEGDALKNLKFETDSDYDETEAAMSPVGGNGWGDNGNDGSADQGSGWAVPDDANAADASNTDAWGFNTQAETSGPDPWGLSNTNANTSDTGKVQGESGRGGASGSGWGSSTARVPQPEPEW